MIARSITVIGAGILGLWQAIVLARSGHRVTLVEASPEPFIAGASRYAGAMLAPDCESESAPAIVRELGREGLALWRAVYPRLVTAGTLVVAAARDRSELGQFSIKTTGHVTLDGAGLATLEPDLAGRFTSALHYPDEAHMCAPDALAALLAAAREAGAEVRLGSPWDGEVAGDLVIDCRGMAARTALPQLRGVRGERLIVRAGDVRLSRPVRLLHPRHPLYVVPWGDGRYAVGATMIESEDDGPMTVRSALELLGTAYALHPAFGEAEILAMGAGVRPAFPDNVPRALMRDGGRRIIVNGAYRHGFLIAPALAQAVAGFIADGREHVLLIRQKGSR